LCVNNYLFHDHDVVNHGCYSEHSVYLSREISKISFKLNTFPYLNETNRRAQWNKQHKNHWALKRVINTHTNSLSIWNAMHKERSLLSYYKLYPLYLLKFFSNFDVCVRFSRYTVTLRYLELRQVPDFVSYFGSPLRCCWLVSYILLHQCLKSNLCTCTD
jgi:hypothetical protein